MTPQSQLPPVPGSGGGDFNPSAMMGGQPQDQNAPDDKVKELSGQIRQLIQALGELSKQAPQVKRNFEMAAKLLTDADLTIVQMQRSPQQPVQVAGA